jgi:hypothetical protein
LPQGDGVCNVDWDARPLRLEVQKWAVLVEPLLQALGVGEGSGRSKGVHGRECLRLGLKAGQVPNKALDLVAEGIELLLYVSGLAAGELGEGLALGGKAFQA